MEEKPILVDRQADAHVIATQRIEIDRLTDRCRHLESLLSECIETGYLDFNKVPHEWVEQSLAETERKD